ncbi:MAG: aminopeptidase, partial [Herbaspirillum sp.]
MISFTVLTYPGFVWRKLLLALLSVGLLSLTGCSQINYYLQAAHGQFALLTEARPIDTWLDDPAASAQLKQRLQLVRQIRQFAVRELALPDNGSYTSYVDLKRPFVLWNV